MSYKKESITVAFMIEQLQDVVGVPVETVVEGNASERNVTESNLHRPGLALVGYLDPFTYQRVQILGNTESQYLHHLEPEARRKAFETLMQFEIPCIFLTENNVLEKSLVSRAREKDIPIYRTPVPSTEFSYYLRDFLGDQFAPQQTVHGSLVDVYGVGMLLTGKSGIGKSEVALDLVERGHRLVADDVVILTRESPTVLMGSGTDLVQHFMEIRGLGIVDVRAMFGVRAIRFQKRVEVVVNMQLWDPSQEYTRIGMIDEHDSLLNVKLPLVRLPITPGKNVTVICEVIAMNHLLRHYGYDSAEVFAKRLSQRIHDKNAAKTPNRGIEYFEHDYE